MNSYINHYTIWWNHCCAWHRYVVLFIAGVGAAISLPPFFLFPLLLIAFPVVFLALEHTHTVKQAFVVGWWFGLGFFIAGLYWISNALLVDTSRFAWLIPFVLIGLNGVLAIHVALVTTPMFYLRHLERNSRIILFAVIWLAVEYLRGHWFTGFPWNLLGYSLSFSAQTMQLASIVGVYGLTLITVLWALSPLLQTCRQAIVIILLIPAFIGLFGVYNLSDMAENLGDTKIAIIQPNIDQKEKWQQTKNMDIYAQHIRMSLQLQEKVDLIIWPETAIPFPYEPNARWVESFIQWMPENTLLISGVTRIERNPLAIYNSIMAFDKYGMQRVLYDKHHLVPFGEYVPLRQWLPIEKITPGQVDFSSGVKPAIVDLPSIDISFLPLICYEVIFPHLAQSRGEKERPDFILNLTNDGWFGNSSGPYQHSSMARMRAVEQGLPLLRAANTGISAVYDARGRMLDHAKLDTQAQILTYLSLSKVRTIYSRYEDFIVLPKVAILLFFVYLYQSLMNRRRNSLASHLGEG